MLKHKVLFLILSVTLSCILFADMPHAQTLIYKKTNSVKEFNSILEIKKKDNGYIIKKVHNNNETNISITDNFFSTLKWTKTDPENNTDIILERKENKIYVSGKFNNKNIDKIFKVNDLPWYQEWGLGLKDFIISKKDETKFWSIDPKKIRIAKFTAEKEKVEDININGKKTEAICTNINLAGFLKMFWDGGKMWF